MSGNDYICFALFIKLIVNNVKYGGIQYDYGQLTKVLFIILASQKSEKQQETIFTQYLSKGQAVSQSSVLILKEVKFTALVKKEWTGTDWKSLPKTKTIHPSCGKELPLFDLTTFYNVSVWPEKMMLLSGCSGQMNVKPSQVFKSGFLNVKNQFLVYWVNKTAESGLTFEKNVKHQNVMWIVDDLLMKWMRNIKHLTLTCTIENTFDLIYNKLKICSG